MPKCAFTWMRMHLVLPLRQNWLRSSTTLFAGLRAWVVGEHTPRLTCARPSNS